MARLTEREDVGENWTLRKSDRKGSFCFKPEVRQPRAYLILGGHKFIGDFQYVAIPYELLMIEDLVSIEKKLSDQEKFHEVCSETVSDALFESKYRMLLATLYRIRSIREYVSWEN